MKIKSEQTQNKRGLFPKLMIAENGMIVLIAKDDETVGITGTILQEGKGSGWRVGDYAVSIIENNFVDYDGQLTLSNH